MADLGQAYVQIIPKATGISNKISNLIAPGSAKAGQAAGTGIAGGIKKALAAAGIGAAIVGVVKSAVSEGGKLEQSYGGLETIYGKAADAAKEYAKQASKAGISANDYAEQAVSFGASLKQAFGGDTTKAVKAANTAIMDMTDNAAKMGTPIENIQNAYQGFAKQNYTMLDNLKLGYGGTKTEMERLLADAEKLTGVKYDISNLGDVYDAIHVIQKDLSLTGTAAQEASETFQGSFNAMKASAKNLLGALALGEDVAPMMSTFVESVKTFLVGNLIPMVQNVFKSIFDNLPDFAEKGGEMLQNLAKSFVEHIPDILTVIADLAQTLVKAGFDLIKGLVYGVAEGIKTLLKPALDKVKTTFSNAWNSIKDTASRIWQGIKTAVSVPVEAIKKIIEGVKNVVGTVIGTFTSIKNAMVKPIQTAYDKIRGIIENIKRLFPFNVGSIIKGAVKLPSVAVRSTNGGKGAEAYINQMKYSWFAKAMNTPFMFNDATLFGAGEAGDEILYGRRSLMNDIATAVKGTGSDNITINLNYNASDDADDMLRDLARGIKRYRRAGAF